MPTAVRVAWAFEDAGAAPVRDLSGPSQARTTGLSDSHGFRSPTWFPTASPLQYWSHCQNDRERVTNMGVGITGISKAKLLLCSHDEKCPCLGENDDGDLALLDEVYSVDVPGRGKDAVEEGCYIAGRGGRRFGLDFNNAAYHGWIRRLSLMALGVEPEEVWNHSRRFRDKPFVELINFPRTDGGAIGPITSAKLYGDFVTFAPRAKRYYATSTPNVFSPLQVNPQSARDKTHRNRPNGLVGRRRAGPGPRRDRDRMG